MSTIRFAKDVSAALRGAESLIVVAPEHLLDGRDPSLGGSLDADLAAALGDLRGSIDDVAAMGNLATTRTRSKPAQLHLVLLPERVSRHNSPSRAEAARRALRKLAPSGEIAVVIVAEDPSHALPLANAIGRTIPELDLKSGKRPACKLRICCVSGDGQPLKHDAVLRETVAATRTAARLVDAPPTEMHPGKLAREARALLRGLDNVTIREIRGAKLLDAKLGGIHAVGRTALEEPRMLICTYTPPRASKNHIALVGKGVTYDTGGLHVKPRGGMESMKCDMGGAAAVLGAYRVLVAASKPRRKLTLILCLAENAIGPAAYKPDDIIQMHSGKTVEINNTDAEGRLLLADGVSYAARNLKADVVIDAATLTGAQMIATGKNHAAVVSDDADLEQLAVEAGRRSGDLVHALPFAPEFHRSEFESPLADMRNSVKDRANAQSSCAATFVHWHLPETGVRWCHVDFAGPAYREDRGTGFGVALLNELVRGL